MSTSSTTRTFLYWHFTFRIVIVISVSVTGGHFLNTRVGTTIGTYCSDPVGRQTHVRLLMAVDPTACPCDCVYKHYSVATHVDARMLTNNSTHRRESLDSERSPKLLFRYGASLPATKQTRVDWMRVEGKWNFTGLRAITLPMCIARVSQEKKILPTPFGRRYCVRLWRRPAFTKAFDRLPGQFNVTIMYYTNIINVQMPVTLVG